MRRIKFGKPALKCVECRGTCHVDCKSRMPMPCVPTVQTPSNKGFVGTVADYAPNISPMIPGIVIHCVNEIERRGLTEVGIYRVNGSEKEIKDMKVISSLGIEPQIWSVPSDSPLIYSISGAPLAWQRPADFVSNWYSRCHWHVEAVFPLAERATHYLHAVGQFRSDRRTCRWNGYSDHCVLARSRSSATQSRHSSIRHSSPSTVRLVRDWKFCWHQLNCCDFMWTASQKLRYARCQLPIWQGSLAQL